MNPKPSPYRGEAPNTDPVRLTINRHDRLRAATYGHALPTHLSRSVLARVLDLRAKGLTFADVADRVPEVLSPGGAHIAFRDALHIFRASSPHPVNLRRPFDGRPSAPAWTPARSDLAATLRPLERPAEDYPSTPPPADYWDTLPWRIDGTVRHPIYGWGRVINGQHTQADGLPSYLP